ncbi:hypothetical protein BJ508DRAFT_366563 [Ascobolus immersus RN42]|uniref:Uncharacterized protein n=1 Tax=Ascobolus immersus RN42 TaxID=1160509 RepID=A0A3N4HIP5_ASCIM|nr:hypothetical protein BJ508DRAFT_366563 [Ascobolus immersus RN42]
MADMSRNEHPTTTKPSNAPSTSRFGVVVPRSIVPIEPDSCQAALLEYDWSSRQLDSFVDDDGRLTGQTLVGYRGVEEGTRTKNEAVPTILFTSNQPMTAFTEFQTSKLAQITSLPCTIRHTKPSRYTTLLMSDGIGVDSQPGSTATLGIVLREKTTEVQIILGNSHAFSIETALMVFDPNHLVSVYSPSDEMLASGYKTGITYWTIHGVRETAEIEGNGCMTSEWVVMAEDDAFRFSKKGDSGGVVVDMKGKVIGLMFASDEEVKKTESGDEYRWQLFTYFTPIAIVLRDNFAATGLELVPVE